MIVKYELSITFDAEKKETIDRFIDMINLARFKILHGQEAYDARLIVRESQVLENV